MHPTNISRLSKPLLATMLYLLLHVNHTWAGDRLLATGGVTQVEGAGGGGLSPWALISGYGTDQQVGGSAFYTAIRTRGGFELSSGGVSVGLNNRLEISLAQQKFGLGSTVKGESIRVDTLGLKLRVMGDAVYDQDLWMPQIAVGVQIKHNEDFDYIPQALGAQKATGVDAYVAASKIFLGAVNGHNLLLNATIQATRANQFGILGFGGDRHNNYQLQPAVSATLMLTDTFFIGTEYRAKPDNLSVYKENDAKDIFLAWFPVKNMSITAAYVDLGNIADKDNQTGWYLSGQLAY